MPKVRVSIEDIVCIAGLGALIAGLIAGKSLLVLAGAAAVVLSLAHVAVRLFREHKGRRRGTEAESDE